MLIILIILILKIMSQSDYNSKTLSIVLTKHINFVAVSNEMLLFVFECGDQSWESKIHTPYMLNNIKKSRELTITTKLMKTVLL